MTNQHSSTNATPPMLTKNFAQLKSEVQKHIKADQVIQGTYWEDNKGCFIGCLAHSDQADYLETEYGIPLMLTEISEAIFERLPEGKHVTFFGAFPNAVATDNKDLSLVPWKFIKAILEELRVQTPEVKTVIEGVSKLAEGGFWGKDAAYAAWTAAATSAVSAERQSQILLQLIKEAPVTQLEDN